jgi:hypothetical protein
LSPRLATRRFSLKGNRKPLKNKRPSTKKTEIRQSFAPTRLSRLDFFVSPAFPFFTSPPSPLVPSPFFLGNDGAKRQEKKERRREVDVLFNG